MPSYAWACAACGSANDALLEECVVCGCPATFTHAQLEYFRAAHLQRGGLVSSGAPNQVQPEDLSAGEVLLAPLTLGLFGVFPTNFLSSFTKEKAGWLLVFAGPGLFIICYAFLGWLDPFAGPEAPTRVAFWSFAVAVAGFLSVALWLFVRAARGRLAAP